MRMLAIIVLLATVHPAFAMNWEGHEDDWRNEFPPAKAFLDALPEAKPLPSPDCPMGPIARADNPYEQIPLPRHNCPAPQPKKLPGSQPVRLKGSMQQDDTEIRAEFMNAPHGKAKVWRVWKRECAEERQARYRSFLAEELRRGEPARQRNADQQLLWCLKPFPLERPHE